MFSEPPGLVLLEVELDNPDEVPDLPAEIAALVVREVSTEPASTNHRLAPRPGTAADPVPARRPSPPEIVAARRRLTPGPGGGTLVSMAPHRPDDDRSDDLPPSEAARARRRDHDAAAAARAGMRTGLAKQFKQVLDAQAKRARDGDDQDAAPRPVTRPTRAKRPARPPRPPEPG